MNIGGRKIKVNNGAFSNHSQQVINGDLPLEF